MTVAELTCAAVVDALEDVAPFLPDEVDALAAFAALLQATDRLIELTEGGE